MNTLPLEDYKRYGRQMILDGFGLPGESEKNGVVGVTQGVQDSLNSSKLPSSLLALVA